TKVPFHSIESRLLWTGQSSDHLAGYIRYRDLDIARRRRLQVIADRRPRRAVIGNEIPGASRVSAKRRIPEPLDARSDFKNTYLLLHHSTADLLQRCYVDQYIHAAAVSGDDQIIVAWMNQQIVDAHSRQAGREALPFGAAVQRAIQPELSARKQQVLVLQVF